ncbi:M1 family metallopeptidase [Flavilitoribacter nigricans]|uniref:Aminopeptidase N n=1 Tax=Flavilitoribacter nigricans (strain ATCC 23147 / DSM 23189 / NBRC 102662 / NCIMB 1420 / SS-2) TaxID=1122177 RepID=A0A2D0N3Y7_FLAN2|nr:M1 family metallopeptidase [Flavilitoribacter nigricans]PHN03262.1 aminopeptidase [Flavilitoribacter nigricans DSM 23189 = NBRC 102662]
MRKQLHQMLRAIIRNCLILILTISAFTTQAQPDKDRQTVDILHYEATIEPDISEKTIRGAVSVQFRFLAGSPPRLELDCGRLTVERVVYQKSDVDFTRKGSQLIIPLPPASLRGKQKVRIFYWGQPAGGVQFFPESRQMYTVFSTNRWMPCRTAPADRASFDLQLILPQGLTAIANGKLRSKKTLTGGKVQLNWRMKRDVPVYCFGFAIGPLHLIIEREYGVKFQYLSADYSEAELREIFQETPRMLRFFERKAGVRYPGACYSQLLPKGQVSQEMQHFTVIRNTYGKQVLEEKEDINLGAHELAHQWWGNQVTCRDWRHFWLNEGMAVFMSSAYREYRFGREIYLEDIEAYRKAYQGVADKELDKPLQFPDWDHPTPEDRTLVYYKGAYFLHLLREELGERIFWKGIRRYTKKYFGKPVVSSDLQTIMEKVSRKDLSRLFAKWVYPAQ